MPVALLYHDVVPAGQDDASGFSGAGAARYKLTPEEFQRHLTALAAVTRQPVERDPAALADAARRPETGPSPSTASSTSTWLMTFDDGGCSALSPIAEELEARGWRGWFFITADRIGTPGFLNADEIRHLHERGHVIGTHTCSHPPKMAHCSWDQLIEEWRRSRAMLRDIIGVPITTASVPGGFYSKAVAQTAARVGLTTLFNSEPVTSTDVVEGCTVVGRYTVYRGMTADQAAALLVSPWARQRQAALWAAKKVAKTMVGGLYSQLRERWLRRDYRSSTAAG